jgi:hypothetical protein
MVTYSLEKIWFPKANGPTFPRETWLPKPSGPETWFLVANGLKPWFLGQNGLKVSKTNMDSHVPLLLKQIMCPKELWAHFQIPYGKLNSNSPFL